MTPFAEKMPSDFSIPEGVRLFAVGDIHGRVDLLRQTMEKIDAHLRKHPCPRSIRIFLGDYIDRGPRSRDVIDALIDIGKCSEAVFLQGNHETFLLDVLLNPAILPTWKTFGGLETLVSYGVSSPLNPDAAGSLKIVDTFIEKLPAEHVQFLKTLPPSFSFGDLFFVHAGVRPGVGLASQTTADLMWIRDEFLQHNEPFEKLIVHGRTPVKTPDVRPNRINIDTGAYATGRLTCVCFEEDRFGFL
jgi:serine/threonine protein phosphatase 1